MGIARLGERLLGRVERAWDRLAELLGIEPDGPDLVPDVDTHTAVTFRAVSDAVIPETPELGAELGPDHVPGGLAVGLEDFHVTYVDDGFQFGLPHVGFVGNAPLAVPVAYVLDEAATELVERGDNESTPDEDRAVALIGPGEAPPDEVKDAAGTFAALAPKDRLRAMGILDEIEVEITLPDGDLFELDAGLVGQLVVGFAEMIYYSEWQGYEQFDRPPSERVHPDDPAAVQSWRQTGFPGFANGYAALRGYVGTPGGPLGNGEPWTTIDGGPASPVRVFREPGSFRENDYDTSGYEEPYPE